MAANDPLPVVAPDLNTYIDLTIKVVGTGDTRVLQISGQLKGDPFPDAEAFMTDRAGNRVMLATFSEKIITSILGSNEDTPLVKISATIPIDKTGQFSKNRPTAVTNVKFGYGLGRSAFKNIRLPTWKAVEKVTDYTNIAR
jgi:hypothetical protein